MLLKEYWNSWSISQYSVSIFSHKSKTDRSFDPLFSCDYFASAL